MINASMVDQNEKFKSDKEGHCFAVVAGVLPRCAWVTLTSSEVGLDHPGSPKVVHILVMILKQWEAVLTKCDGQF